LVDVSDASGRADPVEDYEVITRELSNFGSGLDAKPTIVVASKMDIVNKEKLAKLKRYCKRKKLELFSISAVTGEGVEELKWALAKRVTRG
jgi:GTPase